MDDDNKRRDKPQDDRDEPGADDGHGDAADVPWPSAERRADCCAALAPPI
jgi:hypothetical protein